MYFRESTIPEINYGKLNSKSIANLVLRMAKRYELEKELHPETTLRQNFGGLRYLIHKKYYEKSIGNPHKLLYIQPLSYIRRRVIAGIILTDLFLDLKMMKTGKNSLKLL